MRRVAPILLTFLAVTVTVTVTLAAPPAGAQSPTPLRASVTSCSVSGQVAVFTASMPAIADTRSMAVRFDLQSRRDADAEWAALEVPGLGVYKRSSAGQTGFVFAQRVRALAAPGAYRAIVRFRWYARGGAILKTARRTTGACTQPDQRPDLRPGVLAATLLGDGRTARYSLAVLNAGSSEAGAFAVDVAGVRAQVPGLGAGGQTTVIVDAPRCYAGDTVAVTLDPGARVDEARESDDSVQRACPLG